jgi:hypothetical protein
MLEKEEAFYQANKAEFRMKYAGKRLLIVGQNLLGVFNTDSDALNAALKIMKWEDDFMIKAVPRTPEDEIAKFFSPVFAKNAAQAAGV